MSQELKAIMEWYATFEGSTSQSTDAKLDWLMVAVMFLLRRGE